MRRCASLLLLVLLLPFASAAAPDFPALSGRVMDGANILSSADEAELTGMLAAHEERTSNQVVVVTLPGLQGYTIEDFGYQLGRHWGIGQEGRDNGVLLIVAPDERKVRIEVGYGLEGTLTDALSRAIIETEIVPRFKAGDYPAGIRAGTAAILGTIDGTYEPSPEHWYKNKDLNGITLTFLLMLGAVVVLAVLIRILNRGSGDRYTDLSGQGRHHSGHYGGGGFGGGGGFSGGGGGFGGGGSSGSW